MVWVHLRFLSVSGNHVRMFDSPLHLPSRKLAKTRLQLVYVKSCYILYLKNKINIQGTLQEIKMPSLAIFCVT